MKYLYLFCILAYVSAEDKYYLQASPACQCNDTLDQIISVLTETSKEVVNIRNIISKIKVELSEAETEVISNTDKIDNIDADVNILDNLVNKNMNIINYQTFIINDIDAKVKALEEEEEALECLIEDNICKLNTTVGTITDLETCSCAPKPTTLVDDRTTPTPYYYQH